MAAVREQTVSFDSGGYSADFNAVINSVEAGSLLVIALYHGGAATVTGMGDGTNTYTLLSDSGDVPAYADGSAYYSYNSGGGNLTINITLSGYSSAVGVIREYSNIITTDPLDQKVDNEDGGYVISHSTGTTGSTTQAVELVVAWHVSDSATATNTIAGFSNNTQNDNGAYGACNLADKDVTATGTQAGTFSSAPTYTNGWSGIATFKEIVVASTTPLRTLMGAGS